MHIVVEANELYLLMGKELEKIKSVPAGNVFGLGGVEDIILKTATVSTTERCPPFLPMTFGVSKKAIRKRLLFPSLIPLCSSTQ